jgi:transposase InsO family protein
VGDNADTLAKEALVHRNARLNLHGRRLLIARIQQGRPIAHVAHELGVSRQTAYKWWGRWRREGDVGLVDRSSRPRRCPTRTPRSAERRVEALRRTGKLGPARIAGILELPASTVHRILCRRGVSRLAWMDRPTGTVIRRRIEHTRPGEQVQVDIKKLGRIPPGGGWRVHGRGNVAHHSTTRVGYAFIHTAIDSYSRLVYSEVLDDEKAVSAIGFWRRAAAWFAEIGISVEVVQTDNGACYKTPAFSAAVAATGARHRRLPPRRPQWNGKVERFHRTLLNEWAYVRGYRSENARTHALTRWLHLYNHHRAHTSLGGQPPMTRVNNLTGQHT